MKITKEELLKIAHMSNLEIHEQEIAPLLKQIDDVLGYAQRVKDLAAQHSDVLVQDNDNANVFRSDVVDCYAVDRIVQEFPDRQDRFIVVPAVLENTK